MTKYCVITTGGRFYKDPSGQQVFSLTRAALLVMFPTTAAYGGTVRRLPLSGFQFCRDIPRFGADELDLGLCQGISLEASLFSELCC